MPVTRSPGSFGVKAFIPPMAAPHAAVGGIWVGSSYPWTQIAWGSSSRASHPHGGWCCSGEVRLGQRFVGRRSFRAKKSWLLGKRPTAVGRSLVVPSAVSPVASGAGSWRFLNR